MQVSFTVKTFGTQAGIHLTEGVHFIWGLLGRRGGLMVSALDSGAGVQVRALAGEIVLCSWARHFTLTVSLSTQVYKWVPANLVLGVTLQWTSIPSSGE